MKPVSIFQAAIAALVAGLLGLYALLFKRSDEIAPLKFSAFTEKLHRMVFGHFVRTGAVLGIGDAYGGPGGIPTAQDFAKYRVTDANSSEVIRQRLFDFQLYPLAGVQLLTFFNQGQGNGVTSTPGAVVGSTKTLSDTNMQLGGQLPSGKEYLAETVEVWFIPGSSAVANTFVPAKPTTEATAALLAAAVSATTDIELIYNTGLFRWNLLDKDYLQETPLRVFPPRTWFELDSSVATTVAATSLSFSNMRVAGRPYYLEPPISMQPASNWSIKIEYPAAQALPSGFNGRIGVVLDGYLRRASQ